METFTGVVIKVESEKYVKKYTLEKKKVLQVFQNFSLEQVSPSFHLIIKSDVFFTKTAYLIP